MARLYLDKIKKIDKQHNNVHDRVIATYTTFELDGEKFLQIDTYGREAREDQSVVSV